MGDDDGVYLRIQGGATSRQYEHYRALCNSRVNRFGADPLAGAVGAEVEEEARAAHASGWRAQILAEIGNSTDSHPEVRVAPVADSCGERGQIDVAGARASRGKGDGVVPGANPATREEKTGQRWGRRVCYKRRDDGRWGWRAGVLGFAEVQGIQWLRRTQGACVLRGGWLAGGWQRGLDAQCTLAAPRAAATCAGHALCGCLRRPCVVREERVARTNTRCAGADECSSTPSRLNSAHRSHHKKDASEESELEVINQVQVPLGLELLTGAMRRGTCQYGNRDRTSGTADKRRSIARVSVGWDNGDEQWYCSVTWIVDGALNTAIAQRARIAGVSYGDSNMAASWEVSGRESVRLRTMSGDLGMNNEELFRHVMRWFKCIRSTAQTCQDVSTT
ncbi:hypothetical protein GGX14DRAFT_677096 [Mycena pura]|uniref:Uncharacterized protein n=1 Tax=Mycena pura TaxID=153505 RepID=A0AAD6Y5P6_9AGAR|nr:hypothetical protein GGX14DRAFT_677096 [Mycena pura]